MKSDDSLRTHLLELLRGEHAHGNFESAIKDFPTELSGKQTNQVPYTAWQLLEHLRISQWDILEFSRNANDVSPEWPAGYWPTATAPQKPDTWEGSVKAFRDDLSTMCDLVANPSTDLFASIPHGSGQTILREALLVADHNAYHIGQMVLLRRLINAWP